ncbi:MAG: hypothetical protein ACK5LK_10755 [Chthoniobacterales bacterium]
MQGEEGKSVLSVLRKDRQKNKIPNWELAANFYKQTYKISADLSAPETVFQVLRTADPELKEIQQAAQRPSQQTNFSYGADGNFVIDIAALSDLLSVAQYLYLRSSVEAELGQGDEAFKHLLLIFRLADAANADPLILSFLMRAAILKVATNTIANGISLSAWNAKQLEQIKNLLNDISLPQDYANALRGERAYGGSIIDSGVKQGNIYKALQTTIDDEKTDTSSKQNINLKIYSFVYKTVFLNKGKTRYFQLIQQLIDDAESPSFSSKSSFKLTSGTKISPFDPFDLTLTTITSSKKQVIQYENSLRQARIALELERYKLANTAYPESLSDLNQKLPEDIYSEKAMLYERLSPAEYKLWSIGPDEINQHGKIPLDCKTQQGDIIWTSNRKAQF